MSELFPAKSSRYGEVLLQVLFSQHFLHGDALHRLLCRSHKSRRSMLCTGLCGGNNGRTSGVGGFAIPVMMILWY